MEFVEIKGIVFWFFVMYLAFSGCKQHSKMKEIKSTAMQLYSLMHKAFFFLYRDIFNLSYKTFKQLATRTLVDQICSRSCKETVVVSFF